MSDESTLRDSVETAIRDAFRGVRLDSGVSLKQAAVIDQYGGGLTDVEFSDLRRDEVLADWAAVPLGDLEPGHIPHLDPAGFRYYIAAFMLSVLAKYDPVSMRVISTFGALEPIRESWEYHMYQYSLLTESQKGAIALFMSALPHRVSLQATDAQIIERGLQAYWAQFLS